MTDKSKYASHGAFIKRLPQFGLANWNKPKHAVINPIPSNKPKVVQNNFQQNQSIKIESKAIDAKYKFQQKIQQKPLQQQLTQPFLYIEKVLKRSRVDDKVWNNLVPFVASKQSTKRKTNAQPNQKTSANQSDIPSGYANLFDFEQDKRVTANKLFKKLLDSDIRDIKSVYMMWNKNINLSLNPQINLKESDFVDFMKQLIHHKVTEKQIRHFFTLYKNKPTAAKPQDKKKSKRTQQKQKEQSNPFLKFVGIMSGDSISIKALAFNYERYLKAQSQIVNIMSDKAMKQRYKWVKQYLSNFDENYSQLKQAMNRIKDYQQSLRQHFISMYKAYSNPFAQEIAQLKQELERPIIKYDKHKKDTINQRIQKLQEQNRQIYSRISHDFEAFMDNYENTIVKNHDLFFNKRTICKLMLPIMNKNPYVNKQLLLERIQQCRAQKQMYLECISSILVEVDKDKKFLGEQVFTLGDIVEMILMKDVKKSKANRNGAAFHTEDSNINTDFMIKSMKKLIKQVKKQYLLKNQVYVQDLNQFPADQQIPLQLLHRCFEMQCTKVLLKNQIWSQLVQLIPQTGVKSKYHQHTISCNECLEYTKKYFIKLDEKSQIERNKSKEISLLIENANLDDLWHYNNIIEKINLNIENFVEDDDQQLNDQVAVLAPKKKVGFLDFAESVIDTNNQQHYSHPSEQRNSEEIAEQNFKVKDILKNIFQKQSNRSNHSGEVETSTSQLFKSFVKNKPKGQQIPQSLDALKTLSKSFFVPEKDQKLSTNAFDIRFFEKIIKPEQNPQEQQLLRMGTSILLSNLPKPDKFEQTDPLKLSRFISNNINSMVEQEKRIVRQKKYDSNVAQGIENNYFKEKIKLQNRPTRYDSEGNSKYSVLFPVGYYEGFMVNQQEKNDDKQWYLRSHHVQTLTENPLSKKDNLIHSEYQSKMDKIPLKKRPDQFVIQENVKRKDELIHSLEDRISALKNNLNQAKRSKQSDGQKVPNSMLNNYLTNISVGKEDKDLQMAAYQAVLYDLRRGQKQLLVEYRQNQNHIRGIPESKWWERKDSSFNNELKKQRLLVADSLRTNPKHREYVGKLQNKEIY